MNTELMKNIRNLRDITGVSLVLCKEALISCDNNLEKAILYLKKKNLSTVNKVGVRSKLFGSIYTLVSPDMKDGVIVEINCNTDFVAKSTVFVENVVRISKYLLSTDVFGKNYLLSHDELCVDKFIEKEILNLKNRVREEIIIKRVKRVSIINGHLVSYHHMLNNYAKLGAMLHISECDSVFINLAKDICMHIVALNPEFISIQDIPEDILIEKKLFYLKTLQARVMDKDLLNKIINNYLKKYFARCVLLEQPYIKDDKNNVAYIINGKFKIINFIRFDLAVSDILC